MRLFNPAILAHKNSSHQPDSAARRARARKSRADAAPGFRSADTGSEVWAGFFVLIAQFLRHYPGRN
jgi:hypothetical protein